MGWSFSVPCKSRKAQAEMLAFLGEHFRDSHKIVPEGNRKSWRAEYPNLPSDYVKYGSGKIYIGFNSPNGYEQALLLWIAFRVGKRRKFSKLLGINDAVPWVNHDRERNAPVITRDQWNEDYPRAEQYIVDEIGWRPHRRVWESYIEWPSPALLKGMADHILRVDKLDKAIRAEIERLEELWNA